MPIHPAALKENPLRPPHWRFDRVIAMIRNRPAPLPPVRLDDHAIRVYRKMLLELANTEGDEALRAAVTRKYSDVYHAHSVYYAVDVERRQMLEAWLLTSETFEQLAVRFAMEPKAVEYYELLFFNVRERIQHRGWIIGMIRSTLSPHWNIGVPRPDIVRGYVWRLLAFYGGPEVLEAAIHALAAKPLSPAGVDVADWHNESLKRRIRTLATEAAAGLEIDQKNGLRLLKLACRLKRRRLEASGADVRVKDNARMQQILEAIEPRFLGVPPQSEQRQLD